MLVFLPYTNYMDYPLIFYITKNLINIIYYPFTINHIICLYLEETCHLLKNVLISLLFFVQKILSRVMMIFFFIYTVRFFQDRDKSNLYISGC